MLSVSHIASCDVLWTLCLSPSMILIRGRVGGEGGRDREVEWRAKCVEGQALQGVSGNIKKEAALPTCFFSLFFFFLVLLVFCARRRVHANSDMTKLMRALLGMWSNNMKVKGLIRCRFSTGLSAAECMYGYFTGPVCMLRSEGCQIFFSRGERL